MSSQEEQSNASLLSRGVPNVKPSVLVVEDHDDTRFMLRHLLETWNFRVIEAEDGGRAVYLASSRTPDLILMDISLPHIDGLTAARQLRRIPSLKDVPIIFLTGRAERSFQMAALAAGGNDYLVKPLALDVLEQTINKYVRKINETKEAFFGRLPV